MNLREKMETLQQNLEKALGKTWKIQKSIEGIGVYPCTFNLCIESQNVEISNTFNLKELIDVEVENPHKGVFNLNLTIGGGFWSINNIIDIVFDFEDPDAGLSYELTCTGDTKAYITVYGWSEGANFAA